MAKKRLNKKVALIGSLVGALLALAVLVIGITTLWPRFFGDAGKLMIEAQEAAAAKNYQDAADAYKRAYGHSKNDPQRIQILMALAQVDVQLDDWPNALNAWRQAATIDTGNVPALYAMLRFRYIIADSGARGFWQDVHDQSLSLLKVVKAAGLMDEPCSKYEAFSTPGVKPNKSKLGAYLYRIAGRSAYEIADMGSVVDRDKVLDEAESNLQQAKKLEPLNVQTYWYMAHTQISRASHGNVADRQAAAEKAIAILKDAVSATNDDPVANVDYIAMKFTVAMKGSRSDVIALEPEYLALLKKFPNNPDVQAAVAAYYSCPRLGPASVDKAVKYADAALAGEPDNIDNAINAANLYYRRYCLQGHRNDLDKAISIATGALARPETQLESGPRKYASIVERAALEGFVATCYIEQLLRPKWPVSDADRTTFLAAAQKAVHEIEQIYTTDQDPRVLKWQGLLSLARGDKAEAIRKLYSAYDLLKAADKQDLLLSYSLACIFADTEETGATLEFLMSALKSSESWSRPEATLDYAELMLKFHAYQIVLSSVNAYDDFFGPDDRSRLLRIKAFIGAPQFAEAEDELQKLDQNKPETIRLRLDLVQAHITQVRTSIAKQQLSAVQQSLAAITGGVPGPEDSDAPVNEMNDELKKYRVQEAALTVKLLAADPTLVTDHDMVSATNTFIRTGDIKAGLAFVNNYLKARPDSLSAQVLKQVLAEPNPADVSPARRNEIRHQVVATVKDPAEREYNFALLDYSNGQKDKATQEFEKALDLATQGPKPSPGSDAFARLEAIAAYLTESAVQAKNWTLADKVVDVARTDSLDQCDGLFYAARVAAAKGDNDQALSKIDECLKQRPVFSKAYMLRSTINNALGNEHAAIEDIRKAASLNRLSGPIAKTLAITLYNRDRKLREAVTDEQKSETRTALERAIQLNPRDWKLLSFYAEYISDTDPTKAIAILQSLLDAQPSVLNALLLGNLATKAAEAEKGDDAKKQSLFALAQSAYKKGLQIDPANESLKQKYAEHLRARGLDTEARKILAGDPKLLWQHYYELGQYDDAKKILEQLYKGSPQDANIVEGLVIISERLNDRDAVRQYADKLVSLNPSERTKLQQIQSYLRMGLTKEAELKLQSFNEQFPHSSKAMLLDAWLSMCKGQLQKALELCNKSIEQDDKQDAAWRLRGEINRLLGNYDRAIQDLRQSFSLSPNPTTRVSLAKAYVLSGRDQDAITELKNTINNPGAPVEAWTMLESIYSRLGRKGEQAKFYEDTLKKYPNSTIWLTRAAAFAMENRSIPKAEALFERAYNLKVKAYSDAGIDLSKSAGDALFARALDGYLQTLVLGAGDPKTTDGTWHPEKLDRVFSEASKYLNTPLAPIAYFRMAEARYKLGETQKAVDYCEKAVDCAKDDDSLASEILLRMYLLLGDQQVRQSCQQILKKNPNSVAAYYTLFNLSKVTGDYEKALTYIAKCIELSTSDNRERSGFQIKKADLLTLLYNKSSDKKYLTQAIADYKSLLEKMPTNSMVLNNLAYMLVESGQEVDTAKQYIEQALKLTPDNAGYLDTYGYILLKSGDKKKAVEVMTSAIQQYERDSVQAPPEVFIHLGQACEATADKVRALSAYRQAKSIGKNLLAPDMLKMVDDAIKRLSN